jgi:hypothetical protein
VCTDALDDGVDATAATGRLRTRPARIIVNICISP